MVPSVSIVVPVYNSSQILPELVSRIKQAMYSLGLPYEIILADDCSTDNSWEIIGRLSTGTMNIKGVQLKKNGGQWISTLAGISQTSGKLIVTIDDDLEYEPADIAKLYHRLIQSDCRVVFGIAKEKYDKQGKTRLSIWRKKWLSIFWGTALTDSFKIFYRELVFDRSGTFLPTVLLDAYFEQTVSKEKWAYCPVSFNERLVGNSNYVLYKKIKLFFVYSSHYKLNPINVCVVLFTWAGTLFTVWEFVRHKNIFYGILSVSLLLLSALMLFYLYMALQKKNRFSVSLIKN